jgi:hypothetical protein
MDTPKNNAKKNILHHHTPHTAQQRALDWPGRLFWVAPALPWQNAKKNKDRQQ